VGDGQLFNAATQAQSPGNVKFVVDKMAMGQDFSKYLVSSTNSHSANAPVLSFIIWYMGPFTAQVPRNSHLPTLQE
jgi:hypothetical protein